MREPSLNDYANDFLVLKMENKVVLFYKKYYIKSCFPFKGYHWKKLTKLVTFPSAVDPYVI